MKLPTKLPKMPMRRVRLLVLLSLLVAVIAYALGLENNGFDLSDSLVPADQIHLGGPPRDGIPAIDNPRFIAADKAAFLQPGDRVLGITYGGQSKAYPVKILNWHEVVNDRFGDQAVALTYCPLCGTGVAFATGSGGQERHFGVSGLLYNSDVLLYDRKTESLWSQLMAQAISGPLKGERLQMVAMEHMTWQGWSARYPDTLVLSTDTGFDRDYEQSPYAGYADEADLYFPVNARSRRYHPKERVLGVELNGQFKAYPYVELAQMSSGEVAEQLAGQKITVHFDAESQSARAFDESGRLLPAVSSFWFAWYAFHPETAVFQAKTQSGQ